MKRIADYKDEELVDLLIEIAEPLTKIFADKQTAEIFKKEGKLKAAVYFLKNYKTETLAILKAIDDSPVTLNTAVERIQNTIDDIISVPGVSDFLRFIGLDKIWKETSGYVMASIKADEQ